eukprot:15455063-Alexandrium_andersonii.AAC.1
MQDAAEHPTATVALRLVRACTQCTVATRERGAPKNPQFCEPVHEPTPGPGAPAPAARAAEEK